MPVLTFKGKTAVESYHHTVPHHRLEFDAKLSLLGKGEKSGGPSLEGNLIIEGDNLLALKALLPTHAGKVKCIYIDPPYNTGNEGWVYNDNLNQPQFKEWIDKEVGNELADPLRHDKWCCMMYPRLMLLRELLADDGIILVSIDDNEVASLRMILDEVFGEENFASAFVWNTEGHTDNQAHVKVNHEYIIGYAKRLNSLELGDVIDPNTPVNSNLRRGFAENSITKNGSGNPAAEIVLPKGFPCAVEELNLARSTVAPKFFDEVQRKGWISRDLTRRYNVTYPIRLDPMVVAKGKLAMPCKVFSGWANARKLQEYIEGGCSPIAEDGGNLTFYLSGGGVIYYKRSREAARNILSVLRNLGTTEQARYELEAMGLEFPYPKPRQLISYLLSFAGGPDGLVLDSCAGSGTTGHAILAINREQGTTRRFVLVQQPYDTKEDEAEEFNICSEVTVERMRNAASGYTSAKNGKVKVVGLGGTFTYARVGEPLFDAYKDFGKKAPSFIQLARYVFYTHTSRMLDEKKVNQKTGFIGSTDIGGGTSLYLLYDANDKADREVSTKTLAALAKKDKNPNWVIYAERIWMHPEQRREFQKATGKDVKLMLVPFDLK